MMQEEINASLDVLDHGSREFNACTCEFNAS